MRIRLDTTTLRALKREFSASARRYFGPGGHMEKTGIKPKSSHLSEVLASGLSFKTDADLRKALKSGDIEATIDINACNRRSEQLIGHILIYFPYYEVEKISGLRERLIAENEMDLRILEFLDIGPLHQVLASARLVGQRVSLFLGSMSNRIAERHASSGSNLELPPPSAIAPTIGPIHARSDNEAIIAEIEEAVRENSRQLLNTFKHLEAATPWRSTFDFQPPEFAAEGADRTERVRTLFAQTRRYAAALREAATFYVGEVLAAGAAVTHDMDRADVPTF